MLFVRQGQLRRAFLDDSLAFVITLLSIGSSQMDDLLTMEQVVGDLWERYLKLLDDNIPDGYVLSAAPIPSPLTSVDTLMTEY